MEGSPRQRLLSQALSGHEPALQELIDSGEYTKLLEKWGVQGSGVQTATVNDQK